MAILGLSQHNLNRRSWPESLIKAISTGVMTPDEKLAAVYYDLQMVCYNIADFTKEARWNDLALIAKAPYLSYIQNNASASGHRVFPQGLAEDWLRHGRADSRAAVAKLASTGYAITNNEGVYGEPYLRGEQGTREVAYALMALMEARRCGIVVSSSRIETLFAYAMGHLDIWINRTGTFFRPFMMALTAKALIQYYEQIAQNRTIVTKLATLCETLTFTLLWGVLDNKGSQSFFYTDIDTNLLSTTYTNSGGTINNPAFNTGGREPSVNLNLLIVPVFGWLFKMTGAARWKERGDAVFSQGISFYMPGRLEHIKGAFFGSATNPNGKNINQNFYWSDKYLEWTSGDNTIRQQIEIIRTALTTIEAKL